MNPESFTEQLLFSTVLIKMLTVEMEPFEHGTGFLYSLNLGLGDDRQKILLVSNKHVLNRCRAISIDFHRRSNDMPVLEENITVRIQFDELWVHPTADVACIDITGCIKEFENDIFVRCVGEDSLLDSNDELLDVNQQVFFVGYPLKIYDKTNNLPVVRTGITATHSNIPFEGNLEFLIDAPSTRGRVEVQFS